jgi:hypothetical protein
LSSAQESQNALRSAIAAFLSDSPEKEMRSDRFSIVREQGPSTSSPEHPVTPQLFHRWCRRTYGAACHISGAVTDSGVCVVVMRSRSEDDTSTPLLEALKTAAAQLSGTSPGFIAVQLGEIAPQDLSLPNVQRRASLLSHYVFNKPEAEHLVGTYFCAHRSLSVSSGAIGTPAFVVPNPRSRFQGSTKGVHALLRG